MALATAMRCGRRVLNRTTPRQLEATCHNSRCVSTKAFFPNEPSSPSVKTAIPGPESQRLLKELSVHFDTSNVNMMTNFQKSVGN